jgi:hypothetical protein
MLTILQEENHDEKMEYWEYMKVNYSRGSINCAPHREHVWGVKL